MSDFLSSLFGIGGSSPRTQQVIQSSELPEEIAPFAKEVLEEAKALYQQRIDDGYQRYDKDTIASFTPEQLQAMEGIKRLGGIGKPYQDEALGLIRGIDEKFTADTAKEYMSPYQQAVTDIEKRKAMEDYSSRIMPTFEKRAIDAGGMSGLGSRAGVEAAVLGGKQAERLGDIQAKGLQSAYADAQRMFTQQKQRERTEAADLMAQAPARMKQRLGELGALQTVGEKKQALGQELLDEAYFKHLEEQAFPQEKLAEYSGFVYGNPLMQTRTRTTTSPAAAGPSFGQQLLGLGMAGANIYGMGGGAGFGGPGFSMANLGQRAFGYSKEGGGIASLPIVYRKTSSIGFDPIVPPNTDEDYETEYPYEGDIYQLYRESEQKFNPLSKAIEEKYDVSAERKALANLRKRQEALRKVQATTRKELGQRQDTGLSSLISSSAEQQRELLKRDPSGVWSAGIEEALAPADDPTRKRSLGEVIPLTLNAMMKAGASQRQAIAEKEAAIRAKTAEREFAALTKKSDRETKELGITQKEAKEELGITEQDRKTLKKMPYDRAIEVVALANKITSDVKEKSAIIKNLAEASYARSGKGGKSKKGYAIPAASLKEIESNINTRFNYVIGKDGEVRIRGQALNPDQPDEKKRIKALKLARNKYMEIVKNGIPSQGIKANSVEAHNAALRLANTAVDKFLDEEGISDIPKVTIDSEIKNLIISGQRQKQTGKLTMKDITNAMVKEIARKTKTQENIVRSKIKEALKKLKNK
jgi:hypothetical protein